MNKKIFVISIVCIIIATVFTVIFVGNANKNPLLGIWQEINEYSDDILILDFNEDSFLTEITLNNIGARNTTSYTYSFSKKSETVTILSSGSNDTYRYSISNNTLQLYDDYGYFSTFERINSIDFLEKEQENRKEAERIRQEEEQRRKEEEQRRREEEERKKAEELQRLRNEYYAYCEKPIQSVKINLLGKWERDNSMYRDTLEFFENSTASFYNSETKKTISGTYDVYPADDASDEIVLHFKDVDYEPQEYTLVLNCDDGSKRYYSLEFVEDYILFHFSGYMRRFDKVS